MILYLAANGAKDANLSFTGVLADYIRSRGSEAVILNSYRDQFGNYHFGLPSGKPGVVIALGGDGTFLQCVNDLNLIGEEYPILGVNLGTLGFLTQVEREDAISAVDQVLSGAYTLADYPLLSASVENDRVSYCEQAFNDVVIGREGFARVMTLDVCIDGVFAYQARCDGILISTALGSTAYNVSLGGPVVPPGTPVFVVMPMAPHMPGLRSIIVPETSTVTVRLYGGKYSNPREGLVTCDGRSNGIWLEKDDLITVRKHDKTGKMILLDSGRDFYDLFREKLLTAR